MNTIEVSYSEFWPLFEAYLTEVKVPRFYFNTDSDGTFYIRFNDNGATVQTQAESTADKNDFSTNYLALGNKPLFKKEYSEYLQNGSNSSMDVNGSTTPVIFSISSSATATIVIERFVIYMEDGATIYKALMNIENIPDGEGFNISKTINNNQTQILKYINNSRELHLKTGVLFTANDDFMRVNNRTSMDHATFYFDPHSPIILKKGSNDVISSEINTNLNGLDSMFINCIGYEVNI